MSSASARRAAYDAACEGGALRLEVAGADVALRPSGGIWLQAERALVAADVHFEKGSAYASRGQLLPPYDTRDALERLTAEAKALDARLVVLLGDSFHDRGGEDRLATSDMEAVHALARGRTLVWVTGNHDPIPPRRLPGEAADELTLDHLILRHEPTDGPAPGEVAGHLHPCARIRADGRSVRRRCFVTDGERLILPAFGAYAGGLNVRDQAFGGLFATKPLVAALGPRRVHPVLWRSTVRD